MDNLNLRFHDVQTIFNEIIKKTRQNDYSKLPKKVFDKNIYWEIVYNLDNPPHGINKGVMELVWKGKCTWNDRKRMIMESEVQYEISPEVWGDYCNDNYIGRIRLLNKSGIVIEDIPSCVSKLCLTHGSWDRHYYTESERTLAHKLFYHETNTNNTIISKNEQSGARKPPTPKKWTEQEENDMLKSIKRGISFSDIAKVHNRTENAINMRFNQILVEYVRNNHKDIMKAFIDSKT